MTFSREQGEQPVGASSNALGAGFERDEREIDLDIREGRFQRWLALIAGLSSVLSGIEVTYEHYRGSYSRRVMYTPVILSGALAVAGLSGFFSRRAARTVLPVVSVITLGDLTEEFYETDPKRGFARGFAIQTVGPLPMSFARQMMTAKGAWGWGMRSVMMDYNHWAAFGFLGEILSHAENRVQLAEEKDRFGIPIAKATFTLYDNDQKLIEYGKNKTMEVMWAAGAQEVVQEARYTHLVGAARMGSDPETSVVDQFGRTHDIANLFICHGSIMPTQGSANPGLTIMALAARAADYLIREGNEVFTSHKPNNKKPPMRCDLSPPDTWGHGMPRI